MRALLVCLTLCLFACKEEPDPVDATTQDAGARDADARPDADPDAGGSDADPSDADPSDADPTDADPSDADPNDADPIDADLNDADPNDAESLDADPIDALPMDTGVVDTGSIDGGFLPTFTQNPIDSSFLHAQSAVLVDIENDGDLDVLGAISLDDTIRLYLNNGDGSAWNAIDVAQVGSIVGMHSAAADLDGDGDLDVAAVGLFDRNVGFASQGEVTWYRNPGNPTGNWTTVPITGLTFWGPRAVVAGDLTGDGDPDLVVGAVRSQDQNGTERGHGVHWFRNTGGAFAGPTAIDANLLQVEVVLIHDVDSDGVLDIIASGNMSNEIVWYENQRPAGMVQNAPSFVRRTLFSVSGPKGLALAQRDADAALELFATADNASGGLITLLDPPANPANAWSSAPVVTNFGSGQTVRAAAADLNLDGRIDVAVSSNDSASIRAYVDDGAGGWIERIVEEPFSGVDFVAAGDIDGDGISDLVTGTYAHDPNFDRFDWWRSRP